MRALSIRPPCAELILRRTCGRQTCGQRIKPIEFRSRPTRIIGERRVAAEPRAAGELVRACGALPLAVRITGAKLAARPSWPLSAMVRRIDGDRL